MARPLSAHYRTAFVTGAGSGLGRAFAAMLAAEGVRVWATSRDPARLDALVRAQAGRVSAVGLDLADAGRAEQTFRAAAAAAGGRIDLLVNNAGYGVFGTFERVEASAWERQLSEMLGTTLRLCHAAWTTWRARPGPAALVNVSSLAVEFALPFLSGYNASKAGLSALSESLILEARGTEIAVLDFRPGDYRTGFNRAIRRPGDASDRLGAVWATLERNLAAAPEPERAAADLRRALRRRRSGTVRSGSFFQARLAPAFARVLPQAWQRAISARYLGLR